MSFTIRKENLIDLIQKTYPVIPSRTSLQVLYNFKMSFFSDRLEIIASDLDNFVKASTEISGVGEAEIAVNAKKLFEIVREMSDDLIVIDIEDNALIINNSSGFTCRIMGVDLREFPHFPEVSYSENYTIATKEFSTLVAKSSFAVSRDESRACLCGVLWEASKDRTGMVATDGHRLGASFINFAVGADESVSVIIPPRSLNTILKTSELSGAESLSFSVSEKHIIFRIENFTLSTKIIDGPYPDYEKGIPKEFSKTATITRSDLYNAVKRVSVLSNKKTQLVKLVYSDNMVTISASNRDIGGEAKQSLPVEYSGEEHTIGFNSAYLLEILTIMKSEKVRIDMNSQVSAAILRPLNSEKVVEADDVYLIMPLRIFE